MLGSNYYKAYLFVIAITIPIYIACIRSGNEHIGRSAVTVLGPILIAIRAHWELRKRWWLWATAFAVFSLNLPLILWFRWPHSYIPPVALLPFAAAEFFVTSKAIDLVGEVAKRYSPGVDGARY